MPAFYDARTGNYWISGGEGVFANVPVTVTRVAVGTGGAVYSVGHTIYLLRAQPARLRVARESESDRALDSKGAGSRGPRHAGKTARILALTIPK